MAKKHRGRIQAQGEGLEKSVSWAQDEPLTKQEGLSLLERLKKLLTKKEYERREKPFEEAKRYIENVNGGADAVKKKSFRNQKSKDARVDIEILGGTAFISAILLILAFIFGFRMI
jgi:hypothetical protein